MNTSQCTHLSLLKSSHDTQLKEQQKKFQQTLDDLQRRVLELTDTVNSRCKTEYSASWNIPDFKSIQRRCFKRSKSFSIHGFEWFMGSYFFGDNEESQEYLSVYLFCQNLPPNSHVTLRYTMSVVNHLSPDETISKGTFTTNPELVLLTFAKTF